MGRSEQLAEELAKIEIEQARLKELHPHDYYKPLPGGQRRFWDSALKEKHLFGSNQAGKTTTLVNYVLRECKRKTERWYIGSTSMDRSRKVTQKKVWDWVNKDEVVDSCRYRADEGFRDDCIIFKNGSAIFFLSYEMEQDKWASDTLEGVAFDEEPPWHIFLEAQKRVSIRNGQLISAMTAVKSFTRFVNRVYLEGGPSIGLFTVPMHENCVENGGSFTKQRLQEIYYETPESDRPSRIFGIPTYRTGLVYDEWQDKSPWVIPKAQEFDIPMHWPRYMGIDPHASMPNAAVCIAVAPDRQMYLYKEIWKKCLIPEFALEIKKLAIPVDFEMVIIDNHYSTQANAETGKNIKQLLFEHGGIVTVGGCDDVAARIDMLKCWDRINPITKRPMLQTFESCERTRWERKRYEWQSQVSERVAERRDARQKPKEKDGHLMNACEYLAAHGGKNGLEYVVPTLPQNMEVRKQYYQKRAQEEAQAAADYDDGSMNDESFAETCSSIYE